MLSPVLFPPVAVPGNTVKPGAGVWAQLSSLPGRKPAGQMRVLPRVRLPPLNQDRCQFRGPVAYALYACVQSALGEVDRLAALLAVVCLVEFVGEYFDDFVALGALAGKRLEMLVAFKSGAVLRCAHGSLLHVYSYAEM
jgi:hypothetical protein